MGESATPMGSTASLPSHRRRAHGKHTPLRTGRPSRPAAGPLRRCPRQRPAHRPRRPPRAAGGAKGSGKAYVFIFFVRLRWLLPQVIRKFVARTREKPYGAAGVPRAAVRRAPFLLSARPRGGCRRRRRAAHWRKPIQTNSYLRITYHDINQVDLGISRHHRR